MMLTPTRSFLISWQYKIIGLRVVFLSTLSMFEYTMKANEPTGRERISKKADKNATT